MLATLLPAEVFTVLLVFVRIGAAVMLMPGIGDPYVAARARLLLALLIALLAAPTVAADLPALPDSTVSLVLLIVGEVIIGLFIGSIARFFMAALTTAGMIVAYSASLANALTNDPTAAQQGSVIGSFLTVVALLLIFSLDLHHLLLRATVGSYALFVPGEALPAGDFSEMISALFAKTFLLAFQISAPFVAVSIVFYLGVGLLARLMPQVQIFFVIVPLHVAIGLVVLFFSLPVIMHWFIMNLEEAVMPFAAL